MNKQYILRNNVFNAHKITTEIRNKPINKVFLFTNARDEKNIKEWAAHHLLLGFDMIYIFDHKSHIPLKKVFTDFDKRVIVERCELDNPVKLPLMKRAAKISNNYGADWMIYLDADEFLVLNGFVNVSRMLLYNRHADSLAINWLMFGTNGHKTDPTGLIIENYTKSEFFLNNHVKTFVRPSQITGAINPHYYNIINPMRMISINNRLINKHEAHINNWHIEYHKARAFIAHYVNQSEETYYKRKIALPRDDVNAFRKQDENIHSRHNDVDNFLIRNKYAGVIKDFLHKCTQ